MRKSTVITSAVCGLLSLFVLSLCVLNKSIVNRNFESFPVYIMATGLIFGACLERYCNYWGRVQNYAEEWGVVFITAWLIAPVLCGVLVGIGVGTIIEAFGFRGYVITVPVMILISGAVLATLNKKGTICK